MSRLPGTVTRALALLWLLVAAAPAAFAQTPSPLQEWQYSSGIALYKLYVPDQPVWQEDAGLALESHPLWEGSKTYRELVGPVLDLRYKDLAFASVGEGLGYNILRNDNFRLGVALGYDLGRLARDDLEHLKGLGDVPSAAVSKLFASYVVSKSFPLVMRADVREFLGGADGMVADLDAYLPLPGSSEKLVMFLGSSVTFADRLHEQTLFGVDPNQAFASGYRNYQAHGGLESAGVGLTVTRFVTKHWLLNLDLAANRLYGSAAASPITETRFQGVAVLSVAYRWH
jgi:outer membrane scaffolding protein for murein synthesis (MipA/OmpV family)